MHGDDHKAKMKPRHDSPPGLETDGQANIIPLEQRTPDDQEKSIAGLQDAMHGEGKPGSTPKPGKPPAADR